MLVHPSLIQIIRTIQTFGLGLILVGALLFGVGQSPATAAPLAEIAGSAQTTTDLALDLKAAVDRTLTSIPAGYYKIDNVAELKRLQANAQAQLVDVREPAEYRAGHIPEAINIPLRRLTQQLEQIDCDRPVVLYCSSGYRSAMGVVTLHLLGYDNVKGFPPSFAAWQAAGEAIDRP